MQESCAILTPLPERRCKDILHAQSLVGYSRIEGCGCDGSSGGGGGGVNAAHVRNLSPMVVQLSLSICFLDFSSLCLTFL